MELLKKIHAKVKHDGYLTFDKYMDMCLYYPNLGYYNNKNISLDPTKSDFVTGPEISSIYTDSIKDFYSSCKNNMDIDFVIEFGAGSGELAFNFLKDLNNKDLPKKYFIVEKSDHLKKQQKEKIKKLPGNLSEKVEWINKINNLKNVFLIANEVLDAIPSKIFIKEKNNFYEKITKIKNNDLYYSKMKCEPLLKEEIINIEKRLRYKFPDDYNFEINFQYEDFFSEVFKNIENFIFLLIDYGYSEKEYYHPERSSGTIQFYKDHKNENFEIVALAFENAKTIEKVTANLNRLKERIGIDYPILIAQTGSASKKLAAEKLPMLNHILSYPTTIFIDKKGTVRKIHTGFSGPATGEKYEKFKHEFERFVETLSNE